MPPGRRLAAAARGCGSYELHPEAFYQLDEEGWERQGCKELTHVPESQLSGRALSLCVYLNLLACLRAGAADGLPAAARPAMLAPGSSTPRGPGACFAAQPVPLPCGHKEAVKVNN